MSRPLKIGIVGYGLNSAEKRIELEKNNVQETIKIKSRELEIKLLEEFNNPEFRKNNVEVSQGKGSLKPEVLQRVLERALERLSDKSIAEQIRKATEGNTSNSLPRLRIISTTGCPGSRRTLPIFSGLGSCTMTWRAGNWQKNS